MVGHYVQYVANNVLCDIYPQGRVELNKYALKAKCGLSNLLDKVNWCTQYCVVHSNLMNLPNMWNYGSWIAHTGGNCGGKITFKVD